MSTEVLQITMAWERKRKQAEADLRDQLNEAEDTITEMGDKVATLERELAAAKHDAEIASDMVKSVNAEKAEIARDLKDEQVRVLGALFLIADLAQEPPKEVCEHAASQFEGDGKMQGDSTFQAYMRLLDKEEPDYRH